VHADADDIARLHVVQIDGGDGFVDDERITVLAGSGGGQHEEPAGCDDGGAERHVTWIDKVNAQ